LALTIFKRKYILSLFTSLLFGLHPITTEPVNGIGFREDLIAVCFFLISWLFYIKYSNTNKLYFFLLSLISFIISLFSKESTVVLPLVLILYTFSFESSKRILKRKYSLLTYFIVLLFYIYLTRYSILSNPNPVIVNYPGNSIHTTFFTMTKVFANYVRLLIIPINLRPDYVVHISHSLFESEVIISIIILTLCILAGILIYRYNKVVFFAIFYFFITLIPVSQIIPFGILMAERFLYISLLSFCIIITILLDKLLKNYKLTLFIPLLGCYSILTFNQNKIWKNEIILWKTTLERTPNSPMGYNNLGVVYERKGQLDKAEEYFKKAIELDKNFVLAYNNLGLVYGKKGQLNKAEEYFKKAIKLDKNYIEAYNNLGIVYEIEGNLNKAEKCYKRVIELKGNKINNSGGVKEE
jgi:tetratricopeptide (TPR) repeat protein